MRLSKKQERAIDIACDIMSVALSSGLDSDDDGSIVEAIDILSNMRIQSIKERNKKLLS